MNGKCCSATGQSRVEALERIAEENGWRMNRHTVERVEPVDAMSRERNHEVEDHLRKVLKIQLAFVSHHRAGSVPYLVL